MNEAAHDSLEVGRDRYKREGALTRQEVVNIAFGLTDESSYGRQDPWNGRPNSDRRLLSEREHASYAADQPQSIPDNIELGEN